MIFSQNLFRRPTNLLSVEIGNQFLFVGAHTQLALPVEFLFEILYVGGLTRIEKACYKRIFVQSTTANITL